MYIKVCQDVEDRSNTHKGCNAMYVEDNKTSHNRCLLKYVEDVEIDQIHIRAVMLCMSKTSKILKQAITGVY